MNNNQKPRRSVPLTPDEKKQLKKVVSSFPTITQAAEHLGISRQVLSVTIGTWSASSVTVLKIREKLATAIAA